MAEFRVYSPGTADANTREERLIVDNGTIVSIRSNNDGPAEIIGSTFTVNGTNLDFTVECPSSTSVQIPFTATDTELWLFDPSEPNLKVYVLQ
jgi:hypothetical protein